MRHITPRHMISFTDELQKEAGIPGAALGALRATRKFFRTGAGHTAALINRELTGKYGRQVATSAGIGAVGGAAVADPEEGLSGRFSGAVKGGLLGAGLGTGRVLATGAGRKAARKGLSNFYQRQKYTLTGKGLGKTDAEKLNKAREIGLIGRHDPTQFAEGTIDVRKFGKNPKKARILAQKERLKMQAGARADKARIRAEERALREGYLSAPGTLHGLLSNPADVLKSGWNRGGGLGKAFAGYGAYETGKGLLEKPEEGGPGRLEKGLRGAGSAVGWMVAPGTLLGGQMIGMGGSSLGGKLGRLGDRAVSRFRRPAQVAPQLAPQGQVVPRGGY
jgi:hypothetical protein